MIYHVEEVHIATEKLLKVCNKKMWEMQLSSIPVLLCSVQLNLLLLCEHTQALSLPALLFYN